jgi:hypothetical protein
VTFRGEIYKFINFRRVPLAEIYYSILENFRIAYTDRTGELSIEATSVCGGVAVLPALVSRRVGWVLGKTTGRRAPMYAVWK